MHVYEVRPRRDRRGVDLISDVLPFGRLLYGEPDAVSNAVNYVRFYSRSHDAVIRISDDAGWQGVRDAQAGKRFSRVLTADCEGPGIKRGLTRSGVYESARGPSARLSAPVQSPQSLPKNIVSNKGCGCQPSLRR
jgi:hypothetical protein